MPNPICPICGIPLVIDPVVWRCANGHGFDVAKQGYVNLLPVQQKHSLHPGDTLAQIHARRRFLEAGFYEPISKKVCELLTEGTILDVGCGEGYYLREIGKCFPHASRWGMDISRDAVRLAAGADKKATFFVGTASKIPFPAESFDTITSLFALTMPEEYRRILRPGGHYLQVLAEEDHLENLKSLIYPVRTHREKLLSPEYPGFQLVEQCELTFDFSLTNAQQVQDLLAMTPHYWRIDRDGAMRAEKTTELHDTAHIRLNLYVAG